MPYCVCDSYVIDSLNERCGFDNDIHCTRISILLYYIGVNMQQFQAHVHALSCICVLPSTHLRALCCAMKSLLCNVNKSRSMWFSSCSYTCATHYEIGTFTTVVSQLRFVAGKIVFLWVLWLVLTTTLCSWAVRLNSIITVAWSARANLHSAEHPHIINRIQYYVSIINKHSMSLRVGLYMHSRIRIRASVNLHTNPGNAVLKLFISILCHQPLQRPLTYAR